MNIQIAGITGMLGSAVSQAARKRGHAVTATGDITQIEGAGIVAHIVINCAGLVKQRQCSASEMMQVNAVGPHLLAEACDAANARLIQVSTDCVFSGYGPHVEADSVDPEDAYARSKFAGEVTRHPHLTVRTSFVGFGPHGLIARLQHPNVIEHASDYMLWNGHTVGTIANVLITLAEHDEVVGLLHIPGDEQTRWQLCNRLKSRYNLPATVERDDKYFADRRLWSHQWKVLRLLDLPSFATQLEQMEPKGG